MQWYASVFSRAPHTQELLDDPGVDAVYIPLPTGIRKEVRDGRPGLKLRPIWVIGDIKFV